MHDHPDDTPCPLNPDAAATWRSKRGIGAREPERKAKWDEYNKLIAEKRARERDS